MTSISITSRSDSTALKQPKELFSFSRSVDATWSLDEEHSKKKALSYYYFPDSYIDKRISLAEGLQNFRRIPDVLNVANFPSFLQGIRNYEQGQGKKVKADIITFRGIMTKLITLVQNEANAVELYAIAFDQQIFIKNDDEAEKRRREAQAQEIFTDPKKKKHLDTCEFVGYKFETLVTLSKPWAECTRPMIEKRTKKVVNNYEQYISVVRSGIGKVKTLLAGEVDCLWDFLPEDGEDILPHYMELKTSRIVESPAQAITFEKKLFRTWAQCFLLGIKRIAYGFRDDQYILKGVEVYDTEEIPVLIKNNEIPRNNNPSILCMDALKWYGLLLEWLLKNIDLADELVAYKITYDGSTKSVHLRECTSEENHSLRNGGILTDEFKEWRNSIAKK